MVYELIFTSLPQQSFTACDVVELYLHRGAFEPTLSDEDNELDPDRWCSHCACGQECWQVIAQWVWNFRLELGHVLAPLPVRTVSRLLLLCRQHQPSGWGLAIANLPELPASESGPFHRQGLFPPT